MPSQSCIIRTCISNNPSFVFPFRQTNEAICLTWGLEIRTRTCSCIMHGKLGISYGGSKGPSPVSVALSHSRIVAPDVGPDVALDVAPDVGPDVAPDVALDVAPDVDLVFCFFSSGIRFLKFRSVGFANKRVHVW